MLSGELGDVGDNQYTLTEMGQNSKDACSDLTPKTRGEDTSYIIARLKRDKPASRC